MGALLAVPASAAAKPTKTDRHNAAKECRLERGSSAATREAFRVRYGTNKNKRNAFGKCVSRRSRDEAAERKHAAANAAKQCRAERTDIGQQAFADKYGTNKNKKNAFGKCVSAKAKADKAAADKADRQRIADRKGAAKDCRAERKELGRQAFADKYGTNKNKRNAFGKCVSGKAKDKAGARS
jgi:ribosomal protein L33